MGWPLNLPARDLGSWALSGPPDSVFSDRHANFILCRGIPILDVERPHVPASLPLLWAGECTPILVGTCKRPERMVPCSRLHLAAWVLHRSLQAAGAMPYRCQGQGKAFNKC